MIVIKIVSYDGAEDVFYKYIKIRAKVGLTKVKKEYHGYPRNYISFQTLEVVFVASLLQQLQSEKEFFELKIL